MDFAIVIPVFNQLQYTKGCLESLREELANQTEVIVVDNASSDGTHEFLASRSDITLLTNGKNTGCAAAWNQGFRAASAEWITFLNNDVIAGANWLRPQAQKAKELGAVVISPGMREGPLNYSLADYAADYTAKMKNTVRRGAANGACFTVHRG